MNSLVLALIMGVGYIIAYHTYGKFLARKIFKLNPQALCPSLELKDDHDYVPTRKHILFGHHYTSIAGLGPIIGPAIAIIWGWVPAAIWVLLGSIFFGAVHDFGALVISLRAQGRSIGDVAAEIVNKRVRTLFLAIIFFELLLVIAVFALIIAILFTMYPIAVIPVWFEVVIAIALGWWIYKRGKKALWPSIIAVAIMYITVGIGAYLPVNLEILFGMSPKAVLVTWILAVFILDAWIASSLPVQTLLQPRDFINSHQLFIAMALVALGVIVAHPPVVAPATNFTAAGAPPIWPFIFVVIACGAISGFHSLVSSGTTSKQCKTEKDSLFIGYGGMLLEGALSTLAIIAVAAGIGMGLSGGEGVVFKGVDAFNHHYANWGAANGLGSKIGAFIYGSANMIQSFGIPSQIALAVMAVFIVSFAATTVDTATRIQSYVVVELAKAYKVTFISKKWVATLIAVVTAALLAFYDGSGKGALKLWPLFGTVNQLLAGLALMVMTIYLARRKVRIVYTFVPMVFMVVITTWAMIFNINKYFSSANWLLLTIGAIVFLLQIWMIIESLIVLKNVYFDKRQQLEARATSDDKTKEDTYRLIERASKIADSFIKRKYNQDEGGLLIYEVKLGSESTLTKEVDKILEYNPQDPDILFAKSEVLFAQMEGIQGVEVQDKVLAQKPDHFDCNMRRKTELLWPNMFNYYGWYSNTEYVPDLILQLQEENELLHIVRDGFKLTLLLLIPAPEGINRSDIEDVKWKPLWVDSPYGPVFFHYCLIKYKDGKSIFKDFFLNPYSLKPDNPRHGNWLIKRLCRLESIFIGFNHSSEVIFNKKYTFPLSVQRELKQIETQLEKVTFSPEYKDKYLQASQWHRQNTNVEDVVNW